MNKLFFWVCAVLMTACTSYKNDEVLTESGLSKSRFQTEINGEKTDLFVLKNKNKMEVCITNYGGRIVSVIVSVVMPCLFACVYMAMQEKNNANIRTTFFMSCVI